MRKIKYYPPHCNCNMVEIKESILLVRSADVNHKGEDLKDRGTWSGENDLEEWKFNF